VQTLLEVIVASLDDARAAAAGGADRFEMCSALALGGLTPSLGLLEAVRAELATPVMFMCRPREGGMAYTAAEVAVLERDAEHAVAGGAAGLVFGFLTADAAVDVARCRSFMERARRAAGGRALQFCFHRAYDVVADPHRALEELVDLGVTRVLTSGRAPTAAAGLDEIRRRVEQAAGRIVVMPGGGIRVEDAAEVVRRTGVSELHVYLTRRAQDPSAAGNPAVRFGATLPGDETEYRVVDERAVRRARAALATLK
jgi:copper homeostasis protein